MVRGEGTSGSLSCHGETRVGADHPSACSHPGRTSVEHMGSDVHPLRGHTHAARQWSVTLATEIPVTMHVLLVQHRRVANLRTRVSEGARAVTHESQARRPYLKGPCERTPERSLSKH